MRDFIVPHKYILIAMMKNYSYCAMPRYKISRRLCLHNDRTEAIYILQTTCVVVCECERPPIFTSVFRVLSELKALEHYRLSIGIV